MFSLDIFVGIKYIPPQKREGVLAKQKGACEAEAYGSPTKLKKDTNRYCIVLLLLTTQWI